MRESNPYSDWYEKSQEELIEYVEDVAGLGGLSDAHTRLNLSPDDFKWRFRELPVATLLRIRPKADWRRWYENEKSERRDEEGDDNYFDGLEQEWGAVPSNIGPIVVVTINGELDIGDGWHRAAIAVTQGWDTVPAVVGGNARPRRARTMREDPTSADVWYHGSPKRFERFHSRVGRTFGQGESEVPIFLTRDPKFAALYAGASGYVYKVRPRTERTFDARSFVLSDRYWPPEREALTAEGRELYDDLIGNRIFPELIRYGTRHEDDDEWGAMHDSGGTYSSIFGRDYDVLETTEMKQWLRAHGYDSFFVAGDGPDDNLAVFDPAQIEILGTVKA